DVCVLYASSTDFYSLSLHDALPICFYGVNSLRPGQGGAEPDLQFRCEFSAFIQAAHPQAVISRMIGIRDEQLRTAVGAEHLRPRSEEHTSELQSRENLVCRLLLEKK